jgi:hypothetical protein
MIPDKIKKNGLRHSRNFFNYAKDSLSPISPMIRGYQQKPPNRHINPNHDMAKNNPVIRSNIHKTMGGSNIHFNFGYIAPPTNKYKINPKNYVTILSV